VNAVLRGHPILRLLRPADVLVLAALFALLAPTAGLLADAQFAGWEPGHGHIGSPAAIAAHHHPYEEPDPGSPGADSAASDAASDVTFTPSDEAGGVPALLLAREPAPLPAPIAPTRATSEVASSPLGAGVERVPTPPPRA